MQKNWIETNAIFLKHVASKFGQSTKASLTTGASIVTDLESRKLTKFKTKAEKDAHVESLEFW